MCCKCEIRLFSIIGRKGGVEDVGGTETGVACSSSNVSKASPYPGAHSSRTRPACSPHSCRTTSAVIVSSSSPKTSQVHPVGPRNCALPNHYVLDEQRIPPSQSTMTRYHDPPHFELAQSYATVAPPADRNQHHSHLHQQQQRSYSDLPCRQFVPVYTNGRHAFDTGNSCRDVISSSTRPGYRETIDYGRCSSRKSDPRVAPSRCWDDDDDAATTTSGSYVVDPKELCEEIDELFFKDNGKAI